MTFFLKEQDARNLLFFSLIKIIFKVAAMSGATSQVSLIPGQPAMLVLVL
jgi:hypothetical protein